MANADSGNVTDFQTGRGDKYCTEDLPECAGMSKSDSRYKRQRHCRYQSRDLESLSQHSSDQ